MVKIVLASNSPTRKKLLKNAGVFFIKKKPLINEKKIKESLLKKKKPKQVCRELAKLKSLSVSKLFPSYYTFGFDTCLIFGKKFLSKPQTKTEAISNLKMLSGKTHKLYSSCVISKNGKKICDFNDEAKLKMHKLKKNEILSYVKKLSISEIRSSGLYQIEKKGINLFEKIEGDKFTILGLPLLPILNFLRGKSEKR